MQLSDTAAKSYGSFLGPENVGLETKIVILNSFEVELTIYRDFYTVKTGVLFWHVVVCHLIVPENDTLYTWVKS